jgi:NADH-quinone oxidoreductase subunit J
MLEACLFYTFAALAVLAALAVISVRNPIHSTLSLLLAMFSLAALYLTMQATFVAVIHIAVYAGAIVILFLFVIMLIGIKEKEKTKIGIFFQILSTLAVLPLIFLLIKTILNITTKPIVVPETQAGSAQALSELLFSRCLLPFELISLLLLTAIIGAVYLGGKRSS